MRTTTLLNLVYSIPGMIAYLLTIIAIVKLRKKLSPSFTAIYLITAFVNLATHINTWIMYRLRLEPVFFFYYQWMMQPEMEFFKDVQQFLVSYFYFAQNACAFLFTLNRFTAICLFEYHSWFWDSYRWPVIIIVNVISFGICLATRWPAKADFVFNATIGMYDIASNPNTSVIPVMISMLVFGAVMLIICSIMSIWSLYNLIRGLGKSRLERSLTVISLCVFAAQAANIVIVIINSIFVFKREMNGLKMLSDVLPFMSDLFSLAPAAYTLLLPGPIRSFILQWIINLLHLSSRVTPIEISATVATKTG